MDLKTGVPKQEVHQKYEEKLGSEHLGQIERGLELTLKLKDQYPPNLNLKNLQVEHLICKNQPLAPVII